MTEEEKLELIHAMAETMWLLDGQQPYRILTAIEPLIEKMLAVRVTALTRLNDWRPLCP